VAAGLPERRAMRTPAPLEQRAGARGRRPAIACDQARFPHWLQRSRKDVDVAKLPVLPAWPALRQLAHADLVGLGASAWSERSQRLAPRTATADRVAKSVCPYCAVGCAQLVYVKDEKIIDIEGDTDSPLSQGCLCPKGAATFQLVTGSHREKKVLHRRPGGTAWEEIPLDRAMDMVAERVKRTRDATWTERVQGEGAKEQGHLARHTLGIAHLGGATLDNEENYLLKKLYTALGIVQVENQARI
jgi:formate dehydrogenase major subunit